MTTKIVTIPDSQGRGFITIAPEKGEEFWITARFEGASVRWKSYACAVCDGLPEFFERMAREKSGWRGTRKWDTGVSGFALKAANEGRSTVDLRIEFEPRATSDGAGFKAVIKVAAEDLDQIASGMRHVIHSTSPLVKHEHKKQP